MDRDTAVRTWRDVCGSDTVMSMGVVTGRMLEDFAARIEAAERERFADLCRKAMPQPVANWSDAQIVGTLRGVLAQVVGPDA